MSKTKILCICIFIVFFGLCAIFYFYKTPAPKLVATQFKCPENYTEDDAGAVKYRNALIDWTTSYFETNPKAVMSDWSMAKSQFWVDNNCIEAIRRSKLSGMVADLKPWEKVDYEVQNALDKAINSTN